MAIVPLGAYSQFLHCVGLCVVTTRSFTIEDILSKLKSCDTSHLQVTSCDWNVHLGAVYTGQMTFLADFQRICVLQYLALRQLCFCSSLSSWSSHLDEDVVQFSTATTSSNLQRSQVSGLPDPSLDFSIWSIRRSRPLGAGTAPRPQRTFLTGNRSIRIQSCMAQSTIAEVGLRSRQQI